MTTKMYSYKRERAKRLYPEPAIFNKIKGSSESDDPGAVSLIIGGEEDVVPRDQNVRVVGGTIVIKA